MSLPDFKKKQKTRLAKNIILISGGAIIISACIFLMMANVRIYKKKVELNAQVESLKNKIQETKRKNDNLQEGILRVNDEKYIEKVAREELDLQKPGEKIISFVMSDNKNSQDGLYHQNILQSWLNWISGWFKK